jgi:hypothetical protein
MCLMKYIDEARLTRAYLLPKEFPGELREI